MTIFQESIIAIPKQNLESWAVIACDQYTSSLEYWDEVKQLTEGKPSYYHCIYPEAYLVAHQDRDILDLEKVMESYRHSDYFRLYPDSYIYVIRTLSNQKKRVGIVGQVDLEAYDYHEGTKEKIRASEKTVEERIPLRKQIRKDAALDVSHIIMYCQDEKRELIESVNVSNLEKIYDFDLMLDGGHIEGFLLIGEEKEKFNKRLEEYERRHESFPYAIGDGNHSLAAAKEAYLYEKSELKRYALVELENLYDPIQVFDPIHRIIKGVDVDIFLKEIEKCKGDKETIQILTKDNMYTLSLSSGGGAVVQIQAFLDEYVKQYGGEIEYIHDVKELKEVLDREERVVGIILPALSHEAFFETVDEYGVYPRKAFSIGQAKDKRYYIETRVLK